MNKSDKFADGPEMVRAPDRRPMNKSDKFADRPEMVRAPGEQGTEL